MARKPPAQPLASEPSATEPPATLPPTVLPPAVLPPAADLSPGVPTAALPSAPEPQAAAPDVPMLPAPAAEPAPLPHGPAMDTLKQVVAGVVAGQRTTKNEENTPMDKAMKSAEELVSFSQGNFEAVMKAGQIWAAGMQDLQKAAAATAQAQVEVAMGTMKALSSVKSLQEAMDLQASLARSSIETAMNETGKMTDASIKLAEQTMAPITARMTLAVEKFGRVA